MCIFHTVNLPKRHFFLPLFLQCHQQVSSHCFKWNVSFNIWWLVMKFGSDINSNSGAQTENHPCCRWTESDVLVHVLDPNLYLPGSFNLLSANLMVCFSNINIIQNNVWLLFSQSAAQKFCCFISQQQYVLQHAEMKFAKWNKSDRMHHTNKVILIKMLLILWLHTQLTSAFLVVKLKYRRFLTGLILNTVKY